MENNTNLTPDFNNKPSSAPLILGLVSFGGLLIPIVGVVCGIIGIILSVKDMKKPNSKYGKIGLILSIIGLILSFAIWIFATMILMSEMGF